MTYESESECAPHYTTMPRKMPDNAAVISNTRMHTHATQNSAQPPRYAVKEQPTVGPIFLMSIFYFILLIMC